MLFKNETLVRVVLGMVFCFGSVAFAGDGPTIGGANPYAYCTELLKMGDKDGGNKCKADADALQKDLAKLSKQGDKCDEAKKEFDKAAKDFKGACPAIGHSDIKDCAQTIANCSKKDSEASSDKKACPSQGADVEKFKDEVQKVEDEVAKLDQKKTDLEPKKAELNETAQKTLTEIAAKKQKAQADFAAGQMKLQADVEKGLNDAQKAALAAYQQKLAMYDQATASLKMIPVQMAQAQVQNSDQKLAEMQIDCYDKAIARVEKKQEEDIKKINAGTFSCGGFNSCAMRMGLNDKAAYQKLAAIYEHDCRISDRVKIASDANQKAANIAKAGIEVQRQSIIQSQSRMITDINSFQTQAAQDKTQAMRTAALQVQAAQTQYTAEMTSLGTQEQTVTSSTQGKIQAIQTQENSIDQQIKVKKSYLKTKQDLLATKEDAADGNDYDKATAKKAEEGFASAGTAADTAKSACCSQELKDSGCDSIYNFLEYTNEPDRLTLAEKVTGRSSGERLPAAVSPFEGNASVKSTTDKVMTNGYDYTKTSGFPDVPATDTKATSEGSSPFPGY
jgi:hypothetical protein